MASLQDCYPDWETFESSSRTKSKKDALISQQDPSSVPGNLEPFV